ncbi:hypothetical protein J4727_20105, partial [Providencia rettgeri]|nr:hypothetical protein [Providencia rettgeri]
GITRNNHCVDIDTGHEFTVVRKIPENCIAESISSLISVLTLLRYRLPLSAKLITRMSSISLFNPFKLLLYPAGKHHQ